MLSRTPSLSKQQARMFLTNIPAPNFANVFLNIPTLSFASGMSSNTVLDRPPTSLFSSILGTTRSLPHPSNCNFSAILSTASSTTLRSTPSAPLSPSVPIFANPANFCILCTPPIQRPHGLIQLKQLILQRIFASQLVRLACYD